ncbi:hypothetical protein CROQUDRAFT_717669 [Cronartium quercuum f. sp. fusiforme G11]|uniref:Uncharacterized protein n=1 Tax=Cronartium quercuum f. sp. fusiforme G11 TaxID=708437 RepID=A0A9P6NEZ5_9BASI|nr:hypothetical protein CROQUDRAFT_717669 [Cronartium quercuum f. sp. fusiforme G11]
MKNVEVLCLTVVLSFIKTVSYAQVLIRGPSLNQINPLVLYGPPEINDNLPSDILKDNESQIQRDVSPNRSPDEIFQGQFDLETFNDVSNSKPHHNSLSWESPHMDDKTLKDTVFMIGNDAGVSYLTSNSHNSKNGRVLQTRSPHKVQSSSGGGCSSSQNCSQKPSSTGKTYTKNYSKNSGGHGSSKHQVKKGFARVCNGGGSKGGNKGGHHGGNKGGGGGSGKQVRKKKKHSSTTFKVYCDCEKAHNGKKHGHKHQGVHQHQHKGVHNHKQRPHQEKMIHHHKGGQAQQQHNQNQCKIGKDNKSNCNHHLKKPKVGRKKHPLGNSNQNQHKNFYVEGCHSNSIKFCNQRGFVRINHGPKHGPKAYKQIDGKGKYGHQSGEGKGFILGGCDTNSGNCRRRPGGFERFDYTELPGGGIETYKPGKQSGNGGGGGGGGEIYYNDYPEVPGGGGKTYKPSKQSGNGGGGEIYYNDYPEVSGGGEGDATYDYSSEGEDEYFIDTPSEQVPEQGGSSEYHYDQTDDDSEEEEEEIEEGDYNEEEQDSLPGFGGGVLIDDSLTGFSGFFNVNSRPSKPGMKSLNVPEQAGSPKSALTPTLPYGTRIEIQFIELCWKTSTLCLPDETVLYEGSDLSMIKKCVQKVVTSSIQSSNNKGCDIVTLPIPQGSSISNDRSTAAYMTQQVLQKINQIKQNIEKIQNTTKCSDECCGI